MYTLRFPFSIPKNKILEGFGFKETDNLTYTLLAPDKHERFYVLKVSGFKTKASAIDYLDNLKVGFMWLLLHRGLPLDNEAFSSCGESKNGVICGNRPNVYHSKEQIYTEVAGSITPRQDYSAGYVLDLLCEGATFQSYKKVIKNSKLQLAFELYGAYFTEESNNAKFLTLMLVFEVLKPKSKPAPIVESLVKKYRTEIQNELKSIESDSKDAIESLKALDGALQYVSNKSITESIRLFVLTTFQNNNNPDSEEMASKATELYKLRGKLVHDGKLEQATLNQAIQDAKNIVEQILKIKFIELTHKNNL